MLRPTILALILASTAQSAVIVDLGAFDGDIQGSVTIPFTDVATGVSASFTTVTLTNSAGNPGPANFLDFDGASKGINNTVISGGESWTFTLSSDSQFAGIDWSGISDWEQSAIQSNAWIGAGIAPGGAEITFDGVTGTFTFMDGNPGDTFDLDDLYGTGVIPIIPAGTEIRIFSPNGDSLALGTDFTWNLVPEPSSLVLFALAAPALLARRSRG